MKYRSNILLKGILPLLLLFAHFITYSQDKSPLGLEKLNKKYGDIIELKKGQLVQFEDSLQIVLALFSHKRPFPKGATKATAWLTISKDTTTEEITLSVHGIEGTAIAEYDEPVLCRGYKFELKSFDYDSSIKIVVNKVK